jgi:hypothetical protein
LSFSGCPESGVDPPINPLKITVDDVSSTEVWLKLFLSEGEQARTLTLKRGDSTIATITMTGKDSLFVDEGLLPKKTYTYTLARSATQTSPEWKATAQATTMDTTSHEFTWQLDTLGDGNSSTLYDIAIINDTLAYAVGAIYLKDSTTGRFDPDAYNLARWDGKKWTLMRIWFYTICGQQSRTSYPASSIFAFSPTDVWIAMSGSQVARWDGNSQTATMCLPVSFSIHKLWGQNPNSVYAVGDGGNIVHYNGNSWQKIESGTTLSILDIWGTKNGQTGETEILAVASYGSFDVGKKLLSIKNNSVVSLPDSGLPPFGLYGLWFEANKKYYVVGAGIYAKNSVYNTAPWDTLKGITIYYTVAIRGTGTNNIIASGPFGDCLHYNGSTWKSFPELMIDGSYINVDVKGKTVAICGYTQTQGVVIIGKQK